MNLGSKYWLEHNGRKVFGRGPIQLLIHVDTLGSLRKAALSMNMSYTQAWHMIAALEEALGYRVLDKRIGGVNGGSSSLTPAARNLTDRFLAMENELNESERRIYSKYFKE